MGFSIKNAANPDPNKQANEIIFFHKLVSNNLLHQPVKFDDDDDDDDDELFLWYSSPMTGI